MKRRDLHNGPISPNLLTKEYTRKKNKESLVTLAVTSTSFNVFSYLLVGQYKSSTTVCEVSRGLNPDVIFPTGE